MPVLGHARTLPHDAADIAAAPAFRVVRFAGRGRYEELGVYPSLARRARRQGGGRARPLRTADDGLRAGAGAGGAVCGGNDTRSGSRAGAGRRRRWLAPPRCEFANGPFSRTPVAGADVGATVAFYRAEGGPHH